MGERVESDEYAKDNVRDFALWKGPKPGEPSWETAVGAGRPGWHIECSAMSMKHLGPSFDIHTGGVDLIFPHHEDEIAQSCAFTGLAEFARYWVHGAFLRVRGEKMSKRFGNFVTVRGLREEGVDPGTLRLLVYQTHYRQELDLTDDALAAARSAPTRPTSRPSSRPPTTRSEPPPMTISTYRRRSRSSSISSA